MKKNYLTSAGGIVLLCVTFCIHSSGQIICIYCYDQNAQISGPVNNLVVNGGLENNNCGPWGGYYCPNSSYYSCDISNWACTGGGFSTYAQMFDNNVSMVVEGIYAAYFGNYFCWACNSMQGDTSCLVNTGCSVAGVPAVGYPYNTSQYGGTAGVSLQQTVNGLTPGNTYVLEFWVGGEGDAWTFPEKGLFAVDVGFGDTLLRNKPTPSYTGVGTRFIVEFIASSASHTIKFTNWGHICGQCTELILDDVRLYTLAELSPSVPSCSPASVNASITLPPSVCQGNCTNVSVSAWGGTPPYTYAWSPNIGTGPGPYLVCPTSSTNYSVIITDANGNSAVRSTLVTVNSPPVVSVSPNTTICSGQNTVLSASGASSYTWSPSFSLYSSTGSSVMAHPTSTTTYTVTGTLNGCTATAQVTVTVLPLPFLSSTSSTIICAGQSTTLNVTGASTYTWSPASSLSASTGNSVTASPTSTTTYTVVGNLNGCTASILVTVTVNPLPLLSATANTSICTGQSTALTASGANTYTWSPAASLSASTGNSVTANPTATTTYTVVGNLNGCTASTQTTVTVNPLPVLSATANTTICIGQSATLTAGGANTYVWSPAASLSASTGNSVTANPTATTTYTVVGDLNGCTASTQVTVTVNPLPVLNTTPNVTICKGDTALLTVTGANTYVWTPATNLSSPTGDSVLAFPLVTTTYTVTGNSSGCTATANVTVTVFPSMTFPFITLVVDTLFCNTGYASYQWYLNSLIITGATNYFYLPLQSGNYTVQVIDGNGCHNEASANFILTGIENHSLSEALIYPNPFSTSATVILRGNNLNKATRMFVYDMLGQDVTSILTFVEEEKSSVKQSIYRNNLRSGIYFYEISEGARIIGKGKFIVE